MSSSSAWNGNNWAVVEQYWADQCNSSVQKGMLTAGEWQRFEVRAANKAPEFVYDIHDGYDDTCEYYNCDTGDTYNGSCKIFDPVRMHGTNETHERLPDLIVDTRSLEDFSVQCAVMDPNVADPVDPLTDSAVVGLRVATATANVGNGPLRVEQLAPGGECVPGDPGLWPCPEGFSCSGSGDCLSDPCSTDNDCPSGLVCGVGGCELPTCMNDADCTVTGRCEFSGTCEPTYDLREERVGQPCNPCSQSDSLYPACDCYAEQHTCDPATNTCQPTTCTSDSDCIYNQVCDPGTGFCAYASGQKSCSIDSECGSGTCDIDTSQGTCAPVTQQVIERVSATGPPATRLTPRQEVLTSDLTFHPPHGHVHFDDYVDLQLVDTSTACDVHPERRDSSWETNCLLRESEKISFCLMDSELFDAELKAEADSQASWLQIGSDLPCNNLSQGMSPGYRDIYGKKLPGQVVMLGTPSEYQASFAGQTVRVEATVNAEEALEERISHNNWAWEFLVLDPIDSDFCDPDTSDPEEGKGVLDCRDYPFSDEERNALCAEYAAFHCINNHDAWCDNYGLAHTHTH